MLRNVSGKRPAVSNLSGETEYKRQNTGKTDEETSPLFHSIDMLTNPENKTVKKESHSIISKLTIEHDQNIQEVLKCYKGSQGLGMSLTDLDIFNRNLTDDDLIFIAKR